MVHKAGFIRFVDKRITKNNDNILYSGNVQFETTIQPIYENRSILYKLIVNHLGVSNIIMKDAIQIFYDTLTFLSSRKMLPSETIHTCILKKTLVTCVSPGMI